VPLDDALHGRKPDPAAGKLSLRVKPLEGGEQLVHVPHIEADAVVADEEGLLIPGKVDAKLDLRRRPALGELPRVADEVGQHDPHQARIRRRNEVGGSGDSHLTPRLEEAEVVEHVAGENRQVDLKKLPNDRAYEYFQLMSAFLRELGPEAFAARREELREAVLRKIVNRPAT
jgi:hypothetical protein